MADTPPPGWPFEASPFHEGERSVQRQAGVEDKIAATGRKVIRNVMPEQHRSFFAQLPYIVVGSTDQHGQPWASVMAGKPGFMQSPSPELLEVKTGFQPEDPLITNIAIGKPLGLLGIEAHTRRRNRVNGTVIEQQPGGFLMRVNRSFGNCPKYIQAREPAGKLNQPAGGSKPVRLPRLDARMKAIIAAADTCFIATDVGDSGKTEPADGPVHGPDVSHRGGKPGFVRIDGDTSLTTPDFVGNYLFNTLGNIAVNPRAGLLFIDYDEGDLLYLACDASVVWDGEEVKAYAGAQRLLRFQVRDAMLVPRSFPFRWGAATLSPYLDPTGSWHAS
jgi:uncharacterized protein